MYGHHLVGLRRDCILLCTTKQLVVQFIDHTRRIAFYAGELSLAYNVMKDLLRLFSRLKNKKAMAVTANNLGILCLTMYRSAVANGDEHFGDMTMADIASEGSAYFTVVIKLGEEQYEQFYEEEGGWSEKCLKFMKCPEEFVTSGFRDIQITADMDCEIKDQVRFFVVMLLLTCLTCLLC